MNIIEALQALRDGKKIRVREWNDKRRFYSLMDDCVVDEKGRGEEINIRTLYALVDDTWELYAEPLKLTPEEIKALKLARDCGFKFIQRDGSLWVSPTGKTMSWVGVHMLYMWIPSLDGLLRSNWITHEPMSINELLKDEV